MARPSRLLSYAAAATLLLLPINARLAASPSWHDPPAAAASSNEVVLRLDADHVLSAEGFPEGDAGGASDLFHEEYWYSFTPLPSDGAGRQRWEVHRTPKFLKAAAAPRRVQQELVEQPPPVKQQPVVKHEVAVGEPIGAHANEGSSGTNKEGGGKMSEEEAIRIVKNVLLSLMCVVMAAMAAGLTMGLYSLDPLALEIKRRASTDERERQRSEELLPLLVGHSKRHRLLVSLLLLNSFANEALPLFLDELLPGKYAAIIVSVTLVLFFGEIVPSAFFTGPNQVEVAAKLVPLVKTVMVVLSPVAVPIAKLLDRVLHDDNGGGHGSGGGSEGEGDVTEGNYYNRTELTAMVRIQYESQLADKRRRKQERAVLLTKKTTAVDGAAGNTVAGTVGAELSSVGGVGTHLMRKQNSTSSKGSSTGTTHTHHSIRSISNELTASTRTTNSILSNPRMPSIHRDEITMIEGALTMTTKRAADVCTPMRRVYALPSDTILDEDTKVEIWARGYSRIPVYCPKAEATPPRDSVGSYDDIDISGIVGVMLVRQLIVVDSAENRPVATLPLATPPCISPSMHLVDLINMFQASGGRGKGGLHLAVVCARPELATEALSHEEPIPKEAGVVGIVTLEDVVEELLQEEIYDEADRDLELSRWAALKWKRFVKKKKLRRSLQEQKKVTFSTHTIESETSPLLK